MNAAQLLAHFDRIADAPDAIPRLRRFILDLAVRGKLVPQDPRDEPASELLKQIQAKSGGAAGRATKLEIAQTLQQRESGLPIPHGWAWARLVEITNIVMGQSPPGDTYNPRGEGVPLINGPVEFSEGPFGKTIVNQYTTAPTNFCEAGDLLLCVRGSTTGRTNVAASRACIGRGVAAIQSLFEDTYVRLFIWSMRDSIIEMGRGIAFPSISRKQIEQLQIALPPLAEQHRIVAKVNELMALCDRLEAARAEREAKHDRLVAASLSRLAKPAEGATAEDAKGHARFVLGNLSTLTRDPKHVRQLRQTILDLAARGKLVPQDPGDEPASELLKRSVAEKARLVKAGLVRKESSPAVIDRSDIPFDLSRTWEVRPLRDIALIVDPNPSHRYPTYEGGTVPILSTQEFRGIGEWDVSTAKHVTEAFLEFQNAICRFADGDIVFARKGRLGLPRFLPPVQKFTFSHTVFIVKPLVGILPTYLLWNLRRGSVVEWLTQEMNQNTGVPTLGKGKLERLPIALPPIAEQRRIVAKIDELMALCDRLKASLEAGAATRRRLLDSLLHRALAPTEAQALEMAG